MMLSGPRPVGYMSRPPRMRDGEDRRSDNRDRWIKQSTEVGNITGNRICGLRVFKNKMVTLRS